MKKIIALAVLLLAACSGGPEYASPEELLEAKNCTVADTNHEVFFAQREYVCKDGRTVSWFANSDARDNYREVAENMGAYFVDEGEQFLIYD